MPIDWSSEGRRAANQVLLSARGTTNARPSPQDRGLSARKRVPEESALEKWARQQGAVLDFVPQYGKPPPIQRQRGLADARRRAEQLVARKEKAEASIAPKLRKDAQSNADRVQQALPFLQAKRGNIPLRLLLGWIDKESSGRLGLEMRNDLDEIGWFQISKEERSKYLNLDVKARARMLTDPEYSAGQGIRLVKFYEGYLQRNFGINETSPAYWDLVKLSHKSGLHAVVRMLQNVSKGGADPALLDWHELKLFVAEHPQPRLSLEAMAKVDEVMLRGEFLERLLAPPTAR